MKNLVKSYRLLLNSADDAQAVINKVHALECTEMLIHIEAVIHNTVLIQNTKKMIEDTFSETPIVLIKIARDESTAVTIYCLNETTEVKTDMIVHDLNQQCLSLENRLKMSRKSMITRYFTDPLTNLPNLYKLRNDMHDNDQGSFIIIHIDNFKLINDFYGFVVGDYILEQAALHLSSILKDHVIYKSIKNK